MRSILAYTPAELRCAFAAAGIEAYRADQVASWVYGRRVRSFDQMTNLGRRLRGQLAADWRTDALGVIATHEASDGTRKLELATHDGAVIEAVIIPEQRRQTLCISSQIGCSLDCSFCATGRLGLGRNLRAEEIVDQVLIGSEQLAREGERLTHLVFMGMGEPLLNLSNVVQAIRILTDPKALALSARRITVSTAGVVPKIAELSAAVPVRLAVSLHATTNAVRDELVPLNRRFPIEKLLEACAAWPASRRDLITFEYTLIRDVNDSDADARRLAGLVGELSSKVNLIPLNEHPGIAYRRPAPERIDRFSGILARAGVLNTVRRSRGDDIYAACGQLGRLSPAQTAAEHPQRIVRYTSAG
jgi:23S rRNA (adenine2503-C2)-methyltransferase